MDGVSIIRDYNIVVAMQEWSKKHKKNSKIWFNDKTYNYFTFQESCFKFIILKVKQNQIMVVSNVSHLLSKHLNN